MTLAAAGGSTALLIEVGAVLLALGLLAQVAARFELSAIPVYLVVGVALGQIAEGPLSLDTEVIEVGADVGIVLLLFMLGLEYTGSELASSLRTGLGHAALDAALNFTPGLVAGLVLGWDFTTALVLGGVTYISSSGIVAKVLSDLNRLGNRETPAVLSILVSEDLAMIVYLPVIAVVLAGVGVLAGVALVGIALAAAAVSLTIAIRWGHVVSRLITARSDEVLVLTTFGFVLLVAGLAEQLQLSAAVGAFLAGIMLSGPVAERSRALIAPLRDLFAAAFFIFFGLSIDAGAIPPVALAAVVLGLLTALTKLAGGWWAAKALGVGIRGRMRAGTVLIARGEFSIVIAGLAVSAGAHPDIGPLAAAYVLFTAFAGALLTRWSNELATAIQDRATVARVG